MNYPVFINPKGTEYTCIAWACGFPKLNWEWYAFEEEAEGIYFGYVMGFENEYGTFSEAELKENGIKLFKTAKELNEISPPIGWKRKKMKV